MTPKDNLQELERSVRRNARLTTGLLVLFVALVAGVLTYAYVRIQKALDPEAVANRIEQASKQQIPALEQEAAQQASKSAPELAREVNKQAEQAIPQARQKLEAYLDEQVRARLRKHAALSVEQFRKYLRENRDTIKQALEAPEDSRALTEALESNIDQKLGGEVRRQAGGLLGMFEQFNAKLKKLNEDPEKLSPSERRERRIVMLLRALQVQGDKGAKK